MLCKRISSEIHSKYFERHDMGVKRRLEAGNQKGVARFGAFTFCQFLIGMAPYVISSSAFKKSDLTSNLCGKLIKNYLCSVLLCVHFD